MIKKKEINLRISCKKLFLTDTLKQLRYEFLLELNLIKYTKVVKLVDTLDLGSEF